MNKDRILALADTLDLIGATDAAVFSMGSWLDEQGHGENTGFPIPFADHLTVARRDDDTDLIKAARDCGTVACIAGWAVIKFADLSQLANVCNEPEIDSDDPQYPQVFHLAAHLLDLDDDLASPLFTPTTSEDIHYPIVLVSPQTAARTLRWLAETEHVLWNADDYQIERTALVADWSTGAMSATPHQQG